jgi:hypothetical protein
MAERKTTDFYVKKLRWLDCLAMDASVDNMAFRVAGIIAQHLNRTTGDTFVGRETIASVIPGRAQRMAAAVKSVDRAIATLERLGYLEVFRPRGRGNSNTYTIRFPQIQNATPMSPFMSENATPVSPVPAAEKATLDPLKGDISSAKRRHGCPPNLVEPKYNLAPGTDRWTFASPQQVFREEESIKRQNSFNQAELNDLAEFISASLGISKHESWEMLIGIGDPDAVDHLRRRMRRGDLKIFDLEKLRQNYRCSAPKRRTE